MDGDNIAISQGRQRRQAEIDIPGHRPFIGGGWRIEVERPRDVYIDQAVAECLYETKQQIGSDSAADTMHGDWPRSEHLL